MEVVLLVVAVIGIALVVVPRLQRRRSRPTSPVTRSPSVRRRRSAPVAVAASWTPSGPAAAEDDGWDDDLGWEGVNSPAFASEAPSAGRWRPADAQDDETWDDDLGWEGVGSNGSGFAGNGNGALPVTAAGPATRIRDVAASPGPAGLEWGASPDANGAAARTATRRKRLSLHPVLLVAVYAAAGIGLVVLVSTVLLGGGSADPQVTPAPAKQQAPALAPSATPDLAGAALDEADADAKAAAAEAALRERVQKARADFRRERARAERAERRQAARVAAAARKQKARAAAAKKRREERRPATPPVAPPAAPPAAPPNNSAPGPGYTAPAPPVNRAPAPPRRRACEFCIG
jgi:hypothetical protein